MKKKKLFILLGVAICFMGLLIVASCKSKSSASGAQNTVQGTSLNSEFPFADTPTLQSFSKDPSIIEYQFAKKLALVELIHSGQWNYMNWNNATLSETPVIIYDFNSKPKYYDYIVFNKQKNAIGRVTVYAQRKNNDIIRSISSQIPNFYYTVPKSSSARICQSWSGSMYSATVRSIGNMPEDIFDVNGNRIQNVHEPTDDDILKTMSELIANMRNANDSVLAKIPDSVKKDTSVMNALTNIDVQQVQQALSNNMAKKHQETSVFWTTINNIKDSINNLSITDIASSTDKKSSFAWLNDLFSSDNETQYGPKEYYDDANHIAPRSGQPYTTLWCGPWVANYLNFVKWGTDDYKFFESCASTTGLFGLGWIFKVVTGTKPMWPSEFVWSLAYKSKIIVDPIPGIDALTAFNFIKNTNNPFIRLCAVDGDLHWTLCYRAEEVSGTWGKNYLFKNIDNGARYMNQGALEDNFEQLDWWNVYFKILKR